MGRTGLIPSDRFPTGTKRWDQPDSPSNLLRPDVAHPPCALLPQKRAGDGGGDFRHGFRPASPDNRRRPVEADAEHRPSAGHEADIRPDATSRPNQTPVVNRETPTDFPGFKRVQSSGSCASRCSNAGHDRPDIQQRRRIDPGQRTGDDIADRLGGRVGVQQPGIAQGIVGARPDRPPTPPATAGSHGSSGRSARCPNAATTPRYPPLQGIPASQNPAGHPQAPHD